MLLMQTCGYCGCWQMGIVCCLRFFRSHFFRNHYSADEHSKFVPSAMAELLEAQCAHKVASHEMVVCSLLEVVSQDEKNPLIVDLRY